MLIFLGFCTFIITSTFTLSPSFCVFALLPLYPRVPITFTLTLLPSFCVFALLTSYPRVLIYIFLSILMCPLTGVRVCLRVGVCVCLRVLCVCGALTAAVTGHWPVVVSGTINK